MRFCPASLPLVKSPAAWSDAAAIDPCGPATMTTTDFAPDDPPAAPLAPPLEPPADDTPGVPPVDAIAQLARLSGCSADRIGGYVALGLLDGGDLRLADTTAIRLIDSLESAGLPAAVLAEAVRTGVLSFRFARTMVAQPTAMAGRTYRQVLAELEMDEGVASAVFGAAGLPFLDLDRQARADDLAFLSIVSRAAASGIRPAALVRAARVFGHALRRMAEAQRDLFRAEVEEPLIAGGMPIGAMLDETSHLRPALQSLGFDAAQVLLHRILEDLVFENIAVRLHATLASLGLMAPNGERLGVVGFADMSGFTSDWMPTALAHSTTFAGPARRNTSRAPSLSLLASAVRNNSLRPSGCCLSPGSSSSVAGVMRRECSA